jgi:hypothetical protein
MSKCNFQPFIKTSLIPIATNANKNGAKVRIEKNGIPVTSSKVSPTKIEVTSPANCDQGK